MLLRTGVQWQLSEQGDNSSASQHLPCLQCGVQYFPFSPPPSEEAPSPQRPRFAELLALSPPFLMAPSGRVPPIVS